MAQIHAQITLPYTTGLPEDVVSNNLYFATVAAPTPEQIQAIYDGIVAFYNDVLGTRTLASFLSPTISRTADACTIKLYDIAETPPRQPISEETFTLGTVPGSTAMPQEVALCASFRAAYVSGQPPARRRGRIYVGPFAPGAATTTGDRPHANLMDRCMLGMQELYALTDAEAVDWCVYSTVDNIARVVTTVWVDNAFDTQRRRGLNATSRITAPAAP